MSGAGIREEAREIPVTGEYDVAVAGGGLAGVAAAVAAARRGARVALIEKMCGLGGLATLGNVVMWLPICDGRGRQVIGGLGEELLRLSVYELKRGDWACSPGGFGLSPVPACWDEPASTEARTQDRFKTLFNPFEYMLQLELLLQKEGVELFYDTRLCAASRPGGRLRHLILENKSGRFALPARAFVDASGDADLCFFAGEETVSLDTSVLCGWHYFIERGGVKLQAFTRRYSPLHTKEDADGPFFRGDDGRDVTQHVLQTRAIIRDALAKKRAENPSEPVHPFALAQIPCMRATRRLKGAFEVGEEHLHQWLPDCVGLTGDWRKAGPVYPLPLSALQGLQNRNLFAAGRCISVTTSVWDVTRAIPGCAVTGEAAGVAAALCALGRAPEGDKLAPAVQQELRASGGLLTPELVAAI